MKERLLEIEWKHLRVAGETSERCSGTIATIRQVLGDLREEGRLSGVKVRVRKTPLPPERIAESNEVLINGTPIEEVLSAGVGETSCPSCASLTGEPSCCRTVEPEGEVYEELSAPIIGRAVLAVLGEANSA